MSRAEQLTRDEVREVMLQMPFEKFERRQYLRYDSADLAYIRFTPALWRQLLPADLASIRQNCERAIADYYERLSDS
jgi:hypothetical protein